MNQTEANGTIILPPRKTREEIRREAILEHMSKETIGLGKLVDEKRWKYGIPDEAFFNQCPAFNRVLVVQIPEDESDTYGETGLIKTEAAKKRDLVEAPRGVIVGAGLQALDELRSNGIDLGHTVGFVRLAPFRRPYATIAGERVSLVVLVSGDIVDSEDLGQQLRTRKVRVVPKLNDEGVTIHQFRDENGKLWSPTQPTMLEDS
jgi:hypothetical protein